MKFAYQPSQQSRPPKWIEIKPACRDDLFEYVEQDLWLYDSDNSGDDDGYFAAVIDGVMRYFKFRQEWYWENWEDRDRRYLANTFEFTEVDAGEARIAGPRDWLNLAQTSFPETNKWPPKRLKQIE